MPVFLSKFGGVSFSLGVQPAGHGVSGRAILAQLASPKYPGSVRLARYETRQFRESKDRFPKSNRFLPDFRWEGGMT